MSNIVSTQADPNLPFVGQVIAEVTKQPFGFVQVTPEHYAEGLKAAGLPPFVIEAVLSIQDTWAKGGFDIVTGDVVRLSGKAPSRLLDLAKRYFA